MDWLRKGSLLVCLWLLTSTLWAQGTDTSPYILIDESAALTLADVTTMDNRFQALSRLGINYPSDTHAVWLRFDIDPSSQPRWLWLYSPRVQLLDYYLIAGTHLEDYIATGEARPAQLRPITSRTYLFSLPNDEVARQVYVRLYSNHPLMSWFEVIDSQGLLARERPNVLFGALLGGLVVLALYSLINAYYGKTTLGLWLAGTYLALALCATANLGFFAVWIPSWSMNQSLVADIAALLSCLMATGFALAFNAGHWRAKRVRYFLRGQLLCLGVLILLVLIRPPFWTTHIVFGAISAALCGLCVSLFYQWRKGFHPARLIALGTLAFLLGFIFATPTILGHDQWQPGGLVFSIFLCAALAGLGYATAMAERRRYEVVQNLKLHTQDAANQAELKATSSFMAKLSHDIRTPMNGVLGMTELLLGTQLSAKQRDYAHTINSSGNELLNLINQILDSAKRESGSLEADLVPIEIGALIEQCVAGFSARAEQQHIELITFIQPQVPHIIQGDPARLRQALSCLLQCAFERTYEGEILVVAALEQQSPPTLRIAIQDSGPSAGKQLPRGLNAPSPDELLAKQLVGIMGGELGSQTQAQAGTTYWISLPLNERIAARSNSTEQSLRGARVLVIDDNETCRKVLVQQCQAWGLEAFSAASGKEALALLRTKATIREYFDVVLMDQNMPGLSGLMLASKINSDPHLNHDLVLIMLTGLSDGPNRISANNAGIHYLLTKPVAGYTLKATLADALSRTAARPANSEPLVVPEDFKVLVAEDNSISTKVILGMLGKLSITPDVVSDGLLALEAMQRQRYDLVLMDCEMPTMDGFTATYQLRQWENAQGRLRTPIVALTAHILPEHRERAEQVGMDGHIGKPLELSQLRELIRQWLSARL